ncbi:kinesin heavy chain [Danaus plexippus plexippus]|uniref:Kinesin-like protein n=1 Tax=Danaus plexippus plexippus TaxID=278856 RepID=A0A212FIF9_DANPL|nr:kinesin heavy chain [Danaus plexippus plexippus]
MALRSPQVSSSSMVYHHRQNTPMRAPPTALMRNLSKSAETLVATTRCGKELKARKVRSTEQAEGSLVKGSSSGGLPMLVKWEDNDSLKSRSRNGSGSSRAASLDRSTQGSNSALSSEEDNINVVVRVRPVNDKERSIREQNMLEFPGKGQIVCQGSAPGQKPKVFSYNVVFEPAATQEDVLEYSGIKRLLEMAVQGFSCTAFCYGQTGSGKTHTLTGPPGLVESGASPFAADHGLVVRSFVYLFQLLRDHPDCHFVLKASFLEIYNEKVMDLLNPGTSRKPLQVRWSKDSRSFYVENLFTVDCEQLDDLFAVLEEGMRNRSVGSHSMNAHSSRSHTVLSVRVRRDESSRDVRCSTHGKINFVDLAGSEMTKRTNSTGKTLEEANNINRSLMVLGYCIAQLSDGRKKGHIPYRDSKLTKLLADSLAGNGVTLMIACISPTKSNFSETLNTLRYAARAKKIKTKPIVKMDARDALILSLQREVQALQAENMHLRTALHVQVDYDGEGYSRRNRGTPQVSANKLYTLPQTELVELVQLHMEENTALRQENTELFVVRDQLLREQELLSRENERLLKKLEDVNSVCTRSPIIPARPAYSDVGSNDANIWTNRTSSTNSVISSNS